MRKHVVEKPIDAKIKEQQMRVDTYKGSLDGDLPEIEASIAAQTAILTDETAANKLHRAAIVRLRKQLAVRTQGEEDTRRAMTVASGNLSVFGALLVTAKEAREKRQRVLDSAERRLERLTLRRDRREAEKKARAERHAKHIAQMETPASPPTLADVPQPEIAKAILQRRASEGLLKMLK